jgi:hypothetical protein
VALSASLIWECRQAGAATNGGGFRNNPFQAPPSAPSVSGSGSGGTVAANTYYVAITYTSCGCETPISGQTSVTTTGATSSITVTHPTDPNSGTGGVTWNCYVGTTSGGPYFPQGTALAIGSNRSITTTPPTSGTQPAGTDRTLSTSPFVVVDNAAITATTAGANSNVITFTGYTPTGADVGNVFKSVSGTNINAGFYEITAITSTTWTVTGAGNLTTAGGAGASIVGNMGGAVDSPSTIGYDATRTVNNTDANRPILQANANSITIMTVGTSNIVRNLVFDNALAKTVVVGCTPGGSSRISNCKFDTMNSIGLNLTGSGSWAVDCELVSCGAGNAAVVMAATGVVCERVLCRSCAPTTAAFSVTTGGAVLIDCTAYAASNNVPAFKMAAAASLRGCLARDGTGGTSATGFYQTTVCDYDRCISYNNAGWGFDGGASLNQTVHVRRCATGANTQGSINPAVFASDRVENAITLSGDPNTNAAGLDFSLNNTAGAGAAVRGLTVAYPGGTTTGYPDAGPVQHADPAAVPSYSRSRVVNA